MGKWGAMRVSIDHPTDRPNFTVVDLGDLTVWFSYRTPIAYHYPMEGYVVRENDWGPTTGRHLGQLPVDRRDRISGTEFENRLEAILSRLSFVAGEV